MMGQFETGGRVVNVGVGGLGTAAVLTGIGGHPTARFTSIAEVLFNRGAATQRGATVSSLEGRGNEKQVSTLLTLHSQQEASEPTLTSSVRLV